MFATVFRTIVAVHGLHFPFFLFLFHRLTFYSFHVVQVIDLTDLSVFLANSVLTSHFLCGYSYDLLYTNLIAVLFIDNI